MDTKEWLERAWKIDNEIDALSDELVSAKERVLSVTAQCAGVKVQTSKTNRSDEAVLKYIEYKNRLSKRLDELYAVKSEIADVISKVGDATLRTLLELRYLRYFTWEQIAEKMDMSAYWVRTSLHAKALEKICVGTCLQLRQNPCYGVKRV
ncbi:DUF1492 domain-containing protein [Congzhengia sp.]|uniref:DUF1492 domain-containing protein n=1 Tax=Congzhengia sp. TaxID=2944168 RepID=UPI0030789389